MTTMMVLATSACSDDDESALPEGTGYGDAVLGLTSQSADGFLDTSQMHGSVILVGKDGDFGVIETEGINSGNLGVHDGVLHASDVEADYRVGRDSVERLPRKESRFVQTDALDTELGHLTVFNSGADDGDYETRLLLDDGEDRVEGVLQGELWNIASCGEEIVALVSSWGKPGNNLRLERIAVGPSGLTTETVRTVRPPRGGPDSAVLGCAGDDWYVLQDLGPRRTDFLGRFTLDGSGRWSQLEVGGDPDWGVAMCGVVDGSLLLMDTHAGVLKQADVLSGEVSTLVDLPAAGDAVRSSVQHTCHFEQDHLVVTATQGDYGDPSYYWYDLKGRLVHELTVEGLGSYLEERGEVVTDMGVALGDPTRTSGSSLPPAPGAAA